MNWLVYALAAMLFFSAANVVLKIVTGRQEVQAVNAQAVGALAAVAVAVLALAYYSGMVRVSGDTARLVVLFMVLASAGFILLLKAMAEGKAAVVTAVLALSTVAVALLSHFLLQEQYSTRELAAMGLAVASVIALVV